MEKIKLTFLGTSQAIPTPNRNHTAIILQYKNENILIDCGEGTQRQFRKANLSPTKVTRLLITHRHGDHILGIPGLLQTLILNNYQKTLYIYGPKGTKKFMKELQKLFIPKSNIKIHVEEVTHVCFETKDFKITALPLDHNTICNGYLFTEKDKIKIDKKKLSKYHIPNKKDISKLAQGKNIKSKGKTIRAKDLTTVEKGRKISFIFDTKLCPNVVKLAKDNTLAIIESTYSKDEADRAKEHKHMTSVQAATAAKKAKAQQLILTHISQRYENKENKLLKEATSIFKNTKIAKDLMKVEL
jgi:ribonuclease Z